MIRHLSFFNFMCFRGMHSLTLGPGAYAITARYESDEGRSNWGGKSAILEGIQLALTGRLNKHRKFDADGWITKGEKEGAVATVLEGDIAIKRERTRGKTTQVRFSTPYTQGPAIQDEATALMIKHLRFDAEDFTNVAYFEQGMMSRLIRTESEKRFDIIRGWLNLEKAEEAESRAKDVVIGKVRELQKLKARHAAIQELLSSQEELENVDAAEEQKQNLLDRTDHLQKEMRRHRVKDAAVETVQAFESLIERGKKLREEIESFPDDLAEKLAERETLLSERYAAYRAAAEKTTKRRLVVSGQFDGKCPVADITCPAKDRINQGREAASKLHEEARLDEAEKSTSVDKIRAKVDILRARLKEFEKKKTLRDALREEVHEMRPKYLEAKKTLKEIEEKGLRKQDAIEEEMRILREEVEVFVS